MSGLQARGVIELVGDASSLEATFVRAREIAARTEQAVTQHAGKASQALSGMAKVVGPEYDKLDAASKRALRSVVDLTAKTSLLPAEYQAWRLQMRGVSDELAGPVVSALAKVQAKQEELRRSTQQTANSMGLVGISAGQASNAMRQLPAQFTDIFTSLASGQPAVTVFLQQGGQIKDMFGGIGNAARAIVSSISPATLAIGAIGGAVAALATAYARGSSEADSYRRSLVLTGNAAGSTVAQLGATAEAVSRAAGTQGKAAEVLAALASTGRVAAADLGKLAEAAIRLEREGGPAVEKTVDAFAELGKDPTKAALKLNEATNFLTVSTLEQIRALEKQGKETEAARVAQNAYADEAISRSRELERGLGTLERGWRSVKDATKGAIDELLNIGRQGDPVAAAALRVEQLRLRVQQGRGGAANLTDFLKTDSGAASELASAEETARLAARGKAAAQANADAAASAARLAKEYEAARAANEKWAERALTNGQKIDKALEENRRNLAKINEGRASAGMSPIPDAEVKRQEQAIRDSFKVAAAQDKVSGALQASRDAAKDWADAIGDAQKIARDAEGSANGLTKAQQRLIEYLTSPAYKQNSEEMRAIAVAELMAANSAELSAAAQREQAKAFEDNARAHQRYLADLDKSIEAGDKETKSLRDQLTQLRGGKDAREEQIALRLEDSAAQYEQIAAGMAADGVAAAEFMRMQEIADSLREQAKLRREIASVMSSRGVDESNARAAKEAERAWAQTANNIGDLLETAIYGGWSAVWQKIKREAVLNFVVNPLAAGGTSLVNGLMGGSSSAGLSGIGAMIGSGSMLGSAAGFAQFGAVNTLAGVPLGAQLGAAGNLIGAGNVSGGLGMGAGAVAPYVAAAAAAYAIYRSLDNSGTPHTGGFVRVDEMGRITDNSVERGGILNADTQVAVGQLASGLLGALNTGAAAFGGGKFGLQAAFESDSNDPSWAIFELLRNGQAVGGFGATSGFASDPQAGFEEFASRASGVVIDTLESLDLPNWAREVLDSLGDDIGATDLAAAVDGIVKTQQAIDGFKDALGPLGGLFGDIGAMSSDAVKQLGDMAGGLQNLSAGLSTYFEAYYSEAERTAMQTASVARALEDVGLAMPATREQFRALVEAQDRSTESGQQAFVTLIGVSDAFAKLTPQVADLTEELQRAAAAVTAERNRLLMELWELQGNVTAIRDFERSQLDESNRALYDQIQSLRDQQDAMRNMQQPAVESATRVRDAWESVTDSIVGEIRRLRGISDGSAGLAAAGSSFAIATARARAGDAGAAQSLPELARALERAATEQAHTATELALLRAQTAVSLEQTLRTQGRTVPGFAAGGSHVGGLRIVGESGPEIAATGPERIYNFDQFKSLVTGGSDAELLAALRSLLAETKQGRTENNAQQIAIARFTAKVAELADKWDSTGLLTTTA